MVAATWRCDSGSVMLVTWQCGDDNGDSGGVMVGRGCKENFTGLIDYH